FVKRHLLACRIRKSKVRRSLAHLRRAFRRRQVPSDNEVRESKETHHQDAKCAYQYADDLRTHGMRAIRSEAPSQSHDEQYSCKQKEHKVGPRKVACKRDPDEDKEVTHEARES